MGDERGSRCGEEEADRRLGKKNWHNKEKKRGKCIKLKRTSQERHPPFTPLYSFEHATLASENLIILITTTIYIIHQLSQFVGETIFKCGGLGDAPHIGNSDWRLYQQ